MILYKKAQYGSLIPFSSQSNEADNPEYATMSLVVNQRNKTNPWIKRKLEGSPLKINNSDGSISTHKLATSEADGKFYVYPTIIEKNGKLEELNPDSAYGYAVVTGTRLAFDNKKFADYYAKNGLIKH